MNLCIVTQWLENYRPLTEITSTLKREYAARHGYDFHEQIGNYCAFGFDYQRIPLLRDILFGESLGKRYEYVWYLGSDAAPVNMTKDVADFLTDETKSGWVCRDVNGLNTDSFILRNTDWSRRWLDFVMSKEPEYARDVWESQRVFQHFVETDAWKDGICVLPHPSINSYDYTRYQWPVTTPGHIEKGHLVYHAPGMNLTERLDTFRSKWFTDLIIR